MSKQTLKIASIGNPCALSGAALPDDPALFDTDRVVERFRGGQYTRANTRVVTPVAHMERHGNLRTRDAWLQDVKALMDDRAQTMKVSTKLNNQLLAYRRRTDHAHPATQQFLQDTLDPVEQRLRGIDAEVARYIKSSTDPLVVAARNVPGVGPVTVAGLQVYVDLDRARNASSMWAYVGIDKPSHHRYEKGKKGGGNKTLRTIVWNTANSMVKNRKCAYREVYDRTKARLAASDRVVTSRNTQGHLVDVPWRDAKPSHRHGAALRAVMKHFLADYWFVGRELAGLDTRPLYVEEKLGHSGIVKPEQRGWQW